MQPHYTAQLQAPRKQNTHLSQLLRYFLCRRLLGRLEITQLSTHSIVLNLEIANVAAQDLDLLLLLGHNFLVLAGAVVKLLLARGNLRN